MSNNRSAFEAIPGKDALVEYQNKAYPAKSYVERDGLVYKSLTGTSTTFLSTQWELIADLREVRVANIKDRNALTGYTATTGTTGIRIPILDNTNVLVLNAAGDPQVGVNNFARYNYNQTTTSWLLLQVGTGATNSNVNNYQLLTNKPAVVSGVTVTAGNGLTGGGSVFGTASAPYAAGGTINVSHADTSSQGNIVGSGYAYIQTLRFDTFGHVTGATSSTWVHPTGLTQNFSNTGYTYIQSVQVNNGHVTSVSPSTWVHPDTSTQANSVNSGNVFIQSIYVDGAGHVTNITTGTAGGGGGGGSPLKVNGDSGGLITMNSGGTLTISGGTNIATVRTGNVNNTGIRINLNPAGTTNQVQYNSGSGLGASANFVFSAGTSTLRSSNYVVGSTPTSGTTSDQILTRNSGSGAVQRLSINTVLAQLAVNNGLTKSFNNVRLGGTLTGNTSIAGAFGLNLTAGYLTVGARSGSTGTNSLSIGQGNLVSGQYSASFGASNKATGQYAISSGANSEATGDQSSAFGWGAIASGMGAHASGFGNGVGKGVLAQGNFSFNHSFNHNVNQTAGHGALADASAILGGRDHNIDATNTNAAIVGGDTIKLPAGYGNFTAVGNLAIWTAPATNNTDDLLVYNATTKKIEKTTRASIVGGGTPPAGSNTQVQFNNSGAFGASANLTFTTGTNTLLSTNINVGTTLTLASNPASGTTGDQILTRNSGTGIVQRLSLSAIAGLPLNAIQYRTVTGFGGDANWIFDPTNDAITLGTRAGGTVGLNSATFGTSNLASGATSFVVGTSSIAGANAIAMGVSVTATGQYSSAFGQQTVASGQYSFAEGVGSVASGGFGSHAEGTRTTASGNAAHAGGYGQNATLTLLASGFAAFNHSQTTPSQTTGHGALANGSAILGGQDHNIAVGNTNAAIIGGTAIKLTGTTYIDHTAVANLAIMSTPVTGIAADDVLVRSSTTGRIRTVTQASLSGGGGGSPGGANTQIQYNNSGAFGGSAELTFVPGVLRTPVGIRLSDNATAGNRMLIAESSTLGNAFRIYNRVGSVLISGGTSTTATQAYPVTIQGGTNTSTGQQGNVVIQGGGVFFSTTSQGGDVQIQGGPTNSASQAGNVSINGGSNTSTGANGNVNITGAGGTGQGGSVNLSAGQASSGNPGIISINAGNSAGSNAIQAGRVDINGGIAFSTAAKGGNVNIKGGANVSTNISGDVNITGGQTNGSGAAGYVNIRAGENSSSVAKGVVRIVGGDSSTNAYGLIISGESNTGTGQAGSVVLQAGTYTSTSSTGGYVKLFGGGTPTSKVVIGGGNTASGQVGHVIISGGTSFSNGAGGNVNVFGGYNANATGNGGNANITGGTAIGNGVGGNVNITAGATNSSASHNGGNVNITGGRTLGSGTGQGGNVVIQGGQGNFLHGNTTIKGVDAATSVSASHVFINGGGNSGVAGVAAGNVIVSGGQNTSGTGPGTVTINGGSSNNTIGGFVTIQGGQTTSATAVKAGAVNIIGGTSSTSQASGGNVVVQGGGRNVVGTNTNGDVTINGGGTLFGDTAVGNVYINNQKFSVVLGATNGNGVMHIGHASILPSAGPSSGAIIYFDGTSGNLKVWKAGAGAPVTLA